MHNHLLVQISNIHLTLDGSMSPDIHPRENLAHCLEVVKAFAVQPDVFILSGDLADSGDAPCYQDLAENFPPGTDVVFVPGNHDVRTTFRRHLLHFAESNAPINQVHWHDGLRVISLDSSIPGEDDGELDCETLEFLRSELTTTAPDGTVVVLHHPPIPSPIASMSRLRLRNSGDLRAVIEGTDVRVVLCGHNHHEALGAIGSVPVWVSPSSAYRADVTSRAAFRRVPGSAFSVIDLVGEELVVSVVPVRLTVRARGEGRDP